MACSLFDVFTIIRAAILCNFSKELALTLPQHVHTVSQYSKTDKKRFINSVGRVCGDVLSNETKRVIT